MKNKAGDGAFSDWRHATRFGLACFSVGCFGTSWLCWGDFSLPSTDGRPSQPVRQGEIGIVPVVAGPDDG